MRELHQLEKENMGTETKNTKERSDRECITALARMAELEAISKSKDPYSYCEISISSIRWTGMVFSMIPLT